jgi:hypothetical protein
MGEEIVNEAAAKVMAVIKKEMVTTKRNMIMAKDISTNSIRNSV